MRIESTPASLIEFYDDGNKIQQWIIVGENAERYFVYLGHIDGKARYRGLPKNTITPNDWPTTHAHLSEIGIQFPELVEKILRHPHIIDASQQDRDTQVALILDCLIDKISTSGNLRIWEVDNAIVQIISNNEKNWSHSKISHTTTSNVVQMKSRRRIYFSNTDTAPATEIPSQLTLVLSHSFPVNLWWISISELLWVYKTVEQYVNNPYDLVVLWAFRERAYDTIYFLRADEEFEIDVRYDRLDYFFVDEEGIDLWELGIPWVSWYSAGKYTMANDDETDAVYTKPLYDRREQLATHVLKDFDTLIWKLRKNPSILNHEGFKESLDAEIDRLSSILWNSSESSKFQVGEMQMRKDIKVVPKHILPAIWQSTQWRILDVRINDQKKYLNPIFYDIHKKFIITRDKFKWNQDIHIRQLIEDMDVHYRKIEFFHTALNLGTLRNNKRSRYNPRALKNKELKDLRNSIAQFMNIDVDLNPQEWMEKGLELLNF